MTKDYLKPAAGSTEPRFGERAEAPAVSVLSLFLRDVQELEPASPEAEDSIIVSVGDLEIIAERYIDSEHEPAHDLRERG